MCDYSLNHVASRPAKVGDRLTTTEFASSYTRGFSAEGRPNVAVCLQPGTELAFEHDVSSVNDFFRFWRRRSRGSVALFRQVNTLRKNVHHDALEFPDGEILMLTHLRPGQHARVLQLPVKAAERGGFRYK